ncbi:modification methylase [candidate division WOR-3 bacterium JGI_Cruoil_03_44_89]|uniref:Methyltransferase n=1 Tax=candidate division WOR-3 bacterium JGI_Cruoil_03_44_89 TaxID=1973748 RepID=A0A235BV53_UNCW3|nr:MAG: modification methylase [candidate division WOR-3 bacterium JGI_Cruoil_03_44_89]
MSSESKYTLYQGDCLKYLRKGAIKDVHLTFVDPPFNQGKDYKYFNDTQPEKMYWSWLQEVMREVYKVTANGGSIYFMQREKNTEHVMRVLREAGWVFQNLIIWKKMTSAVPSRTRYSKQHQIIVFATKGKKPRLFNKLRIDPPKAPHHKYERADGIYVTDVWDDIRELTSGYFAGDEAIRNSRGERAHTQQSPIALLLRIVLSSTKPEDTVFDPFAGTGVTLVVSSQLQRNSIGIEIDPEYTKLIRKRLQSLRPADSILKYYSYYKYTPNLKEIWPSPQSLIAKQKRGEKIYLNLVKEDES